MTAARSLGIETSRVIATGTDASGAWTIFERVAGLPGTLRNPHELMEFVERVLALRQSLDSATRPFASGQGWMDEHGTGRSHSTFLMGQLSAQARLLPWWSFLAAELRTVDSRRSAYLHGDVKPEHFLAGPDRVAVVDWEACARGPAAVDFADAAFHALRDLAYTHSGKSVPFSVLARLPTTTAVLAWRIALWLDRRRPGDLMRITAHDLSNIVSAPDAESALRRALNIVVTARDGGVPR
ncbi:hypothetical protein LP52_18160 [Streptomonospora alba]|uniref:Aminoglycoside phosphotransferase domain-containing protein n=1 Tax=Streptomonospora alba TaxID=183763 RepID=A0A0C2JFN0_9ACTN|nr:hypothetical protein LP52_18160 [Streptomonospora alba]